MARFNIEKISELARQLGLSPCRVRRRQLDRLEALVLEIDPGRFYPLDFIYYRITGFRPTESELSACAGYLLLGDLATLLGLLSRDCPVPVPPAEEVYSSDELARMLGVSRRTLRRWRQRGLAARAYIFPDGRRRMGVRRAALDRFTELNPTLVERSARFARLSAAERLEALELARECAGRGLTRTAAAEQIARRLGRAPETVRLLLERHDLDDPSSALFPAARKRLEGRTARAIWADYSSGVPVRELCLRYGRSRASVYRIINREKARAILAERLDYRADEAFVEPDAEERFAGEELSAAVEKARAMPVVPVSGSVRRWTPPLTSAEEAALFRGYHYALFRIDRLRAELNPARYVATARLREIEALKGQAELIRGALVRLYGPLAEAVARRHATRPSRQEALVAEARSLLGRLVGSYNYRGRGRFASYVTLELLKHFVRAGEGGRE